MTTTSRLLAGRYQLLEPLGEGGMAVVWRAHDETLRRDVAVKLLKPGFASDPAFVRRFRREARHAAALHDRHIVTIHDLGTDPASGADYIVMELVEGTTLQALLEREPRPPLGQALRIVEETAEALQVAHDRGIVHRDVKPANILLDRDGSVHVADFGIARLSGDGRTTTTGVVIGSPEYVSPEQVAGEPITPASDIYSLGVVLFELLTGRPPFMGATTAATALERLRVDPPPPSSLAPHCPAELDEIVGRALRRVPAERYPSAAEMAATIHVFRLVRLGGVRRPAADPRTAGEAAGGRDPETGGGPDPAPRDARGGVLGAASALRRRVSGGGPRDARTQLPAARRAGRRPPRTEPGRRPRPTDRRRSVPLAIALMPILLVVGLGAAAVAIGLSTSAGGASGSVPARGSFRLPPGAVAAGSAPTATVAPASPAASAAPASRVPGVTPSPQPTAPARTPSPAQATPRPPPDPAARPTQPPATTASTTRAADTVGRFYRLVEDHDFGAAAGLWTTRMRRQYPPAGYIDGRFARTTGIDLARLETRSQSTARRSASVLVDLTEHRSDGTVRRFVGTWDLVLTSSGWLMDRPHF